MSSKFYRIRKIQGSYKITFDGTMTRAEAEAERDRLNHSVLDQEPSQSYDFDRGFGIGGLARYAEPPVIPTVQQMERVAKLEAQAVRCRRCGDTDMFDGAMFTTDAASGLCDDCYG